MYPFITIGSFAIPTKPFLYLIAVWLGLIILEKTAERLEQDRATLYSIFSQAIFYGLIGARIIYVAINWPIFAANWTTIFWPLNTGYSLWGGFLVGGLFLLFTIRSQKLSYGETADAATPALLFVLTAIILADFLAGPGYGAPLNLGRLQFHPVQLYELVVLLIAAIVWWGIHQQRPFAGSAFLLTTAVLTFGLIITTPFRGNAWVTPSGWYPAQILYLAITLSALILITYNTNRSLSKPESITKK